jgi:selenocysteine lyase/cysteine desulfurase
LGQHIILQVAEDKHGFCKKDAIYFSGHKFIGGPQTPGILIAKKKLFDPEGAPVIPGGGTVLFVTETDHLYLKDIESKEEGGTPAIVESIRSGLVIQVSLFRS